MIWSFVKIAVFIAMIAALTLGAGYLLSSGGMLRLTLDGTEYTLGPLQAIIGLVVLFALLWGVVKLTGLIVAGLRFLNGDETAISRYFDRNRQQKGYRALAEGMMALASGETRLALTQASRAEKYLDQPELTTLLTAQAAEAAGDSYRASEAYKRLLTHPQSRFVGIRGLMNQKIAQGDTETALKLAEKAFALKPRHAEVQDKLLELQAQAGDWKGARGVLGAKAKQGLLPRDVHKRRDAVMALQEAKAIMDDAASIEVREAAIAANKASPDLIPAATMAARAYMVAGNPKYAARILTKCWEAHPHPDVAAAFAEIVPDETPGARLKRFAPLLRSHPDHPETRMLAAELNLAAEDFPATRRALGDLIETKPTARALTIMAAVERGEGKDDSVVRGWMARALTASRGPQWICDNCQTIHAEWVPVCTRCKGFDTLSWREPAQEGVSMPHGSEMLPLIVAAPTPVVVVEEAETGSDSVAIGSEPAAPEPAVPEPAAAAALAQPDISAVIEGRQSNPARPFAVDYAEKP